MDQSEHRVLEIDEVSRGQRAAVLKIALEALSHRLLTLVAVVLNAGMGIWGMLYPDWLRVVTGLLFAVTCWTLINVQRKG